MKLTKHLAPIFFAMVAPWTLATELNITLGGTESSYRYTAKLLTESLNAQGYQVNISYMKDIPTPRLEIMLATGEISCFILGKTKDRQEKFLTVDIGMTNNLFGHRILFIRQGDQHEYDGIKTLDEFRSSGKVAGMGADWSDVQIWQKNQLPVQTIDGDWRNLYKMLFSGNRNVDYISRGAQEMIQEYPEHPELAIEQNLVLLYQKDHVLFVSPKQPELYKILLDAMTKAEQSGLIASVAREFYAQVYEAPINLGDRLSLPILIDEPEIRE